MLGPEYGQCKKQMKSYESLVVMFAAGFSLKTLSLRQANKLAKNGQRRLHAILMRGNEFLRIKSVGKTTNPQNKRSEESN